MSRPAIALLRKDLRTIRAFWAPMAFSYGVFLLIFLDSRWVFLAAGVALAVAAALTVPAIDDFYRSEPLNAALPGTRRSLVGGHYLGFGVFTGAALALFLAFAALIRAGLPDRAAGLASLLTVQGAAAFLGPTWLAGSVFLPLSLRLGFWRGLWSSLAAGLAAAIAVLYAAPRLAPAGACPLLEARAAAGAVGAALRGFRALAWLVDNALGRPAVLAPAAAVLAALVFASYRLSVRLYRDRDL